jgi:hypothetical protein
MFVRLAGLLFVWSPVSWCVRVVNPQHLPGGRSSGARGQPLFVSISLYWSVVERFETVKWRPQRTQNSAAPATNQPHFLSVERFEIGIVNRRMWKVGLERNAVE